MTTNPPIGIPSDLSNVFLDRDGVLNRKMPEGQYVTSWGLFEILPGVPEAIARLNRAGMRIIVVSNQRGIALGLYSAVDVDSIHAAFQAELNARGAHIDAFYFCPHDRGECDCRKPSPGLFEQARTEFPTISAAASVMIGDSLVDMEFAHRVGMGAVFIDGNQVENRPGTVAARAMADLCCPTLPAAVSALLGDR